jgi:hypothetical protein
MTGLYQVTDCYVSLHRSEGFGYGPAEALYWGKPAIVTAYSGVCDFCTESTAKLVDYELIAVKPGEYPYLDSDRSIFGPIRTSEPQAGTCARCTRIRQSGANLGKQGQRLMRERYSIPSSCAAICRAPKPARLRFRHLDRSKAMPSTVLIEGPFRKRLFACYCEPESGLWNVGCGLRRSRCINATTPRPILPFPRIPADASAARRSFPGAGRRRHPGHTHALHLSAVLRRHARFGSAFHCYGWEESAFPRRYAIGFESGLDLVTVMSRYVMQVLRDNGVTVPIEVVGLGADHILHRLRFRSSFCSPERFTSYTCRPAFRGRARTFWCGHSAKSSGKTTMSV